MQDLRKAADLTADRVGKADCQMECGMILQKQKDYRAATVAFEVPLHRQIYSVLSMTALPTCTATAGVEVGCGSLDTERLQRCRRVQAATRLDPRNVQAINMLGLCYVSRGDLQDGIKAYEKALRLDPALKDAWSNLATAHKEVCGQTDFNMQCCTPAAALSGAGQSRHRCAVHHRMHAHVLSAQLTTVLGGDADRARQGGRAGVCSQHQAARRPRQRRVHAHGAYSFGLYLSADVAADCCDACHLPLPGQHRRLHGRLMVHILRINPRWQSCVAAAATTCLPSTCWIARSRRRHPTTASSCCSCGVRAFTQLACITVSAQA